MFAYKGLSKPPPSPFFIQYLKVKVNMPSAQELIAYMMTTLNDSADEGKPSDENLMEERDITAWNYKHAKDMIKPYNLFVQDLLHLAYLLCFYDVTADQVRSMVDKHLWTENPVGQVIKDYYQDRVLEPLKERLLFIKHYEQGTCYNLKLKYVHNIYQACGRVSQMSSGQEGMLRDKIYSHIVHLLACLYEDAGSFKAYKTGLYRTYDCDTDDDQDYYELNACYGHKDW